MKQKNMCILFENYKIDIRGVVFLERILSTVKQLYSITNI